MTNSASEFKVIDVTANTADGRSAGIRMIASMDGQPTRLVFRKDRFRVAESRHDDCFEVVPIEVEE